MRKRLWLLAFAAVVVGCAWAPCAAGQEVCLDGEWECAWGTAEGPPGPEAVWEVVRVPGVRPWRSEGPHCLWQRRGFFVPKGWQGQRVFVRLEGVKYSQRVYVNGGEVGRYQGGYEPREYDVTERVVFGRANELLVGAEDWTSLIAAGAEVGEQEASDWFGSWVKDGVMAPIGSRGWEVGVWESVFVEARPAVWVADVFAAPSVRERKLRVYVTVKNGGGIGAMARVSLRVAEGGLGPEFEAREVGLEAGEEKVVEFEAEWFDPRLWWPEDPHLYTLVAGARAWSAGDSREARFGFREFWVEGDEFVLNGRPIHLLGTAAHPMAEYDEDPARAYGIAKEAGCVVMRLHAQPWPQRWYEAADECGMLLVWESGFWCIAPHYGLTREEFWENAREHIAAQVRRQRNHPSVVIWSAENELLMCGAAGVEGAEEKIGGWADLIRSLDPTRPVMFDGDGDPAGKADIVNLHYPHELPGWNLWPETAYWPEGPVELDTYPGGVWEWDRGKPLYVGEFLWVPSAQTGAGSVFFGDEAYPEVEAYRRLAKAEAWERQIVALRDAGVSGMCPWNLWEMGEFPNAGFEAHRRAYEPVAAYVREESKRAFAGTVAERTLSVFNDTGAARTLEVRWGLEAGGEWLARGSQVVGLEAAGRGRVRAEMAVPAMAGGERRAMFVVELWEGGRKVFGSAEEWKVYGRGGLSGPVAGAPARVALYDPRGETRRLLGEVGIECLEVEGENARRMLHWTPVAVVGKGAFARPSGVVVVGGEGDRLAEELLAFVRGGGVLVVFEQEYYPPELIPVSLGEHSSTIGFARRAEHPALAGLEGDDLAHWLPDGMVGRREMVKPREGGFLAVVDSGGAGGLETAGLAEVRVGSGRMLLCQLGVTGKFGVDPVATRVARNLLAYASERPERPVVAGVVCDDEAARAFDGIGLRYDRLEMPLRVGDLREHLVLVLRDVEGVTSQARLLREFVRQGGRVVLSGLTPESAGAAERLVGERMAVGRGCDGWVRLVDRGGVAAGMSNEELAWFGARPGNVNVGPSLTADIAEWVVARPYRRSGGGVKVEAEEMELWGGAGSVEEHEGGRCVAMYSNGEVGTWTRVREGGEYVIGLRARGTAAGGAGPRLVVRVDGKAVGSVGVGEGWETLEVVAALAAGEHRLGAAFENDYYAPPEDRNVWVDWVAWERAEAMPTRVRFHTQPGVLASLADGRGMWVVDQVRWDEAGGNGERAARYLGTVLGNLGCGFRHEAGTAIGAGEMEVKECAGWAREGDAVGMWTNGVVEAEVEFAREGEYEFRVRARGTAVGGVYPRVEVRVDGEAVGVADLAGEGWREYGVAARVAAGRHRVGVAFVNDEWKPPEDRNITIGGLWMRRVE